MKYYLLEDEKISVLKQAEFNLLKKATKFKYENNKKWRDKVIPEKAGVYALFDNKENLLYIGETGQLNARIGELGRTVNHSFRRQYGYKHLKCLKTKGKFDIENENKLNEFFKTELYISFIEVNFGRLEIETYLVDKFQKHLLNHVKKRK